MPKCQLDSSCLRAGSQVSKNKRKERPTHQSSHRRGIENLSSTFIIFTLGCVAIRDTFTNRLNYIRRVLSTLDDLCTLLLLQMHHFIHRKCPFDEHSQHQSYCITPIQRLISLASTLVRKVIPKLDPLIKMDQNGPVQASTHSLHQSATARQPASSFTLHATTVPNPRPYSLMRYSVPPDHDTIPIVWMLNWNFRGSQYRIVMTPCAVVPVCRCLLQRVGAPSPTGA